MSRWYDFGFPRSQTVAERRAMAEQEIAALRKRGVPIAPVSIEGRAIARSFWGRAWCDNLESYRDYEYRLPRGRSYVRNASVIDLQVTDLEVRAQVCGSSIYQVTIDIKPLRRARWKSICRDCAGSIDSLVELLQGRFSDAVMERICRQETGLFPSPPEIRFACSCPDWASMCKHVAATLYGVGARLDAQPELLFRLRGVDGNDMVAGLGRDLPLADRKAADGGAADDGRLLEADDLSALFGLEMEVSKAAPEAQAPGPTPAVDAPGKKSPALQPRPGRGPAKPRQKPKKASASRQKAARPKPVERKPASGARKRGGQAKRAGRAASPAEIELTPDGYVKWWK